MRIFVTGDSHVGILRRAIATGLAPAEAEFTIAPLGPGAVQRRPFFELRGDHLEIVADHKMRKVDRVPVDPKEGRFDWYGLSGPMHLHAVSLDPFFHDSPRSPVSKSLFERLVLDRKRHSLAFVEALRALGQKAFVVESPRPFRDHPDMREDRSRVAELETRARGLMADTLERSGVPVVRLPPGCIHAEGLTHERFRHPDPEDRHHANAELGAIMLREIAARLS